MAVRHAPSLLILGRSPAAMWCRANRPAAVISIHGRREFGVDVPGVPRLDLHFDDVDVPPPPGNLLATYFANARRRRREQNGLVEVPPTAADAAAVVAFADRVRDVSGTVLCHCGAGISRSPAAAVICLAVWVGDEMMAAAELYTLRPMVVPHAGLVAFADEQMGYGGRLSAAVITGLRVGAPRGGRT